MTVASYMHGENPRYDKMNYAEVRNELDERDGLLRDMWRLLKWLDDGLTTVPLMQEQIRRQRLRERYEVLGLGD